MRKQRFEPKLVRQLNGWFKDTSTTGIAYRLRPQQGSKGYQHIDILVDGPGHYIGIECKSVTEPATKKIYFSEYFTTDAKGVHQIVRIDEFLHDSGRQGICAIELHDDKHFETRFVPWQVVSDIYYSHVKGIEFETVREWPQFRRVKGVFNFDECLDALSARKG
ncbi:MAG: hypothetical protein ABSC64_02325 [Candidatus Korobacteraceae bacterium]